MFSAQVQYTVAGVLLRGMCPSQQVCLFFFFLGCVVETEPSSGEGTATSENLECILKGM